jgi:hypothetical protein
MALHPPSPHPDDHQGARGRQFRRPAIAKTHIAVDDGIKPLIWPTVVTLHATQNGQPPAYHVIALCGGLGFRPWDLELWVPWDDLAYTQYPANSAAQLGLVKLLLAYPNYISHSCPICRYYSGHPWHVVWNLPRGGSYPWHIPACPWNGDNSYPWTPDQWPPAAV